MTSFIDGHRDSYGVEPICAVLPTCLSADRSPRRLTTNRRLARLILPGCQSVSVVTLS
jgi:hypothetical protein